MELASLEFEVFGKVQGCNFTKEAKDLAERLGLTGWIKNTRSGNILGKIQGDKNNVDTMVKWLKEEGPAECTIEKCNISNSQNIMKLDYPKFTLKF